MEQTNDIEELIIRLDSIAYRFIRNENITLKRSCYSIRK